eukprot:COSAG03_NODE_15054_length_442_cov_1.029155_1_plen_38_part_01
MSLWHTHGAGEAHASEPRGRARAASCTENTHELKKRIR